MSRYKWKEGSGKRWEDPAYSDGIFKVWDGTEWVWAIAKVWDGTKWKVTKPSKTLAQISSQFAQAAEINGKPRVRMSNIQLGMIEQGHDNSMNLRVSNLQVGFIEQGNDQSMHVRTSALLVQCIEVVPPPA